MGNLFSFYSRGFPEDLNQVFIEHKEGSFITYRDLLDQSEKYAINQGVAGTGKTITTTSNIEYQ